MSLSVYKELQTAELEPQSAANNSISSDGVSAVIVRKCYTKSLNIEGKLGDAC